MYPRTFFRLFAVAALATPILAHAQDFTPTGDRIVSDPTYLPLKGEFLGQSGYEYGRTTSNSFGAAGAVSSGRTSSNTFSQSLTYGLTDALSVNVGMDYQTDRFRSSSAKGVTETSPQGFNDPSFGVTYRAIDQRSHPVSVDLFASYSPDVFPAHADNTFGGGTVARGGDATQLGFAVGRETRMFTVQGVFSDTYSGGRSTFNQVSDGTTYGSGYWTPSIALKTQTRFNDRTSINVGADYTLPGNTLVSNNFNTVSREVRQGDYAGVNVSLNYHIIPNALVGSLDYRHVFYDHSDNVFAADPSLDSRVERTGNVFGGTLRYVFR